MKRLHIILLSLLLSIAPLFSTARCGEPKVFALTRSEAVDAVSGWFEKSGFAVTKASGRESLEIRALKGNEEWIVTLKPHSPLASEISASYRMSGVRSQDEVRNLWNFLSGYGNGSHAQIDASSSGIPGSIRAWRESVVCLSAKTADELYQFSGFVVDTSGLILCTAHNLKGVREIVVTFSDGSTRPGTIVKIDEERDLSLSDVGTTLRKAVSPVGGPMSVRSGQKLFSVGCPEGLSGTIYAGVISGPPRSVGGQRLWQAGMKVYPGSSGSPVFDEQGNLVAVVKGRRRGTDSTGFLIPHGTIVSFIRGGRHGKK